MNIVKCKNNHFYDRDIYPKCPHCGETALAGETGENESKKEQHKEQSKKDIPVVNVNEYPRKEPEQIEVKVESTVQSALVFNYEHGYFHDIPNHAESNVYYTNIEINKGYELEHGTCLRIDAVFANGCIYETYRTPELSKKYGTEMRKAKFVKWNQTVDIGAMCSPMDVICCQYVTFKIPEFLDQTLPELELKLSNDDEKWICFKCGFVNYGDYMTCHHCNEPRPGESADWKNKLSPLEELSAEVLK
ncbi:MAG: hypothetical protein LUH03_04520 [Oscillospiraceae bacterium]|nr:hypothetical protein [Oscillospiraceae bacterium]